MTNTTFNILDLLIRYIKNLTIARNPCSKKNQNLALAHILAYLIEVKYNHSYPTKPNHIPSHFTENSFHAFFNGKKQPSQTTM